MTKPLNRETIVQALIVAVRDQSDSHERDDEAVIRRFLAELRPAWTEMALVDYHDACCVIEGSQW